MTVLSKISIACLVDFIREKISFFSFLSSLFPSAIQMTLFNMLDVGKLHLNNLCSNGEGSIVNFVLLNVKGTV